MMNQRKMIFTLPTFFMLSLASVSGSSDSSDSSDSSKNKFRKELCVVGGGAAGAYTAYQAQKRGYDTVLFEPEEILGGNCEVVEVQSTKNPDVTYELNAAVIIFSPTPTVQAFFQEMNANVENFDSSRENVFVFGTPFGTVPAPSSDPNLFQAALAEYTSIYSSPPYAGTCTPLPNFNLYPKDPDAMFHPLLEPFGLFLLRHPGIEPLVPLMALFIQGYGLITDLPMWQIFLGTPPQTLVRFFQSTFLALPDKCQDLYDELKDRMIDEDPASVQLKTFVKKIKRKDNGKTVLKAKKDGESENEKYKCDNTVIAFRPDGLDEKTLPDITTTEKQFFGNLTYNGYVTSIFKMDLGPQLLGIGANISDKLVFAPGYLVDVGIVDIGKTGTPSDWPWRVFYQPAEPADTPDKLEATKQAIIAELTTIGFINIENIWIKNHKYNVVPSSNQGVMDWVSFFEQQNNDGDSLFWTGSAVAGDASEYVWEHAKTLLDDNFPDKNMFI